MRQVYKQMFVFLLTCSDRYDKMQEYRRESCLYSFAVHRFWYGVLPLREEGRITGLRRGAIRSEVAARKDCAAGTNPSRLKDEPRRGFISIRFFRCKASFKVSFSSGEDGLILCYRFFKVSRFTPSPEKDAR